MDDLFEYLTATDQVDTFLAIKEEQRQEKIEQEQQEEEQTVQVLKKELI